MKIAVIAPSSIENHRFQGISRCFLVFAVFCASKSSAVPTHMEMANRCHMGGSTTKTGQTDPGKGSYCATIKPIGLRILTYCFTKNFFHWPIWATNPPTNIGFSRGMAIGLLPWTPNEQNLGVPPKKSPEEIHSMLGIWQTALQRSSGPGPFYSTHHTWWLMMVNDD